MLLEARAESHSHQTELQHFAEAKKHRIARRQKRYSSSAHLKADLEYLEQLR